MMPALLKLELVLSSQHKGQKLKADLHVGHMEVCSRTRRRLRDSIRPPGRVNTGEGT